MALDLISQFMASIRRLESGSYEGRYAAQGPYVNSGMYAGQQAYGAYQIMPGNWNAWAREAGLPNADIRDPAAQDAVARYKFTQYYQKYQDWNLVAIAWFAGGSRADKAMAAGITSVAGIADVTGTTIAKYVEKINQYMDEVPDQYQTASFGGFGGGTLTGGTGGGSTREPIPEGYSGVGSGATIGNVAGAGMAGALLGAGSGGILSKLAPTTVQAPYTYQVTDPNSQLEQFLNQPPGTQQQVPGRAPNMESKMIGILQAISNGVANGSGINLSAGPSDRIRLTSERETI